MKTRTSAKQRKKLNFSVDRGEVEITSDWVDSVMELPATRAAVSDENSATGVVSATEAGSAPVAESSTGSEDAPVVVSAIDLHSTVEDSAAVASPCAEPSNWSPDETVAVPEFSPVEQKAPVEQSAAVVNSATGIRRWHPRPIRLVTDGLTTGQYAVYSIMYDHGERVEAGPRLYRGGYAELCRLTGMSKRGVQNVVGELRQKRAIELHTAPGHRPVDTSAYTILAPSDVVELWKSQGWRFAVGKSKTLIAGE